MLEFDPKYYGPFSISAFLLPVFVILIPNLFFIGSIFFSLATLSRKMVMTYIAGVGAWAVYGFVKENNKIMTLLLPSVGQP